VADSSSVVLADESTVQGARCAGAADAWRAPDRAVVVEDIPVRDPADIGRLPADSKLDVLPRSIPLYPYTSTILVNTLYDTLNLRPTAYVYIAT